MKLSDILLLILLLLVAVIGVIVLMVPQMILDQFELLYAGVAVPILGALWIWFYLSAKSGN